MEKVTLQSTPEEGIGVCQLENKKETRRLDKGKVPKGPAFHA
jgi:hypothetical protein